MGRLEGKSVIITGAGSGIGRAASLLFTKEGAKLIAVDRTEAVKETVEQVRKAGGTAEAVMADAGSEKDVMAFIDRAVSAYGRLDAIWANAGVSGGLVPLAEQTVEHWQEWYYSSRAMMRPMSTDRRFRSTAALPPRCRMRANRFKRYRAPDAAQRAALAA